jgi:hypothetical protein
MSHILRNSLYALYRNDHDILNMLDQLDFSELTRKFDDELYSRMPKEQVKLAQAMLTCDTLLKYDLAVAESAAACTQKLAEMMSVLILPTTGKSN